MTAASGREQGQAAVARGPSTLVWIDSEAAVIVGWRDDEIRLEKLQSEVPAHHRATGHVRHDPGVRHGGGGGVPQTAGEPNRLEHLNRFVAQVASRLPPGDDLLILGPGTVHQQLERHVIDGDVHHGRHRDVACEPSPPLTDRQLVARLRAFAGVEARRQTVGAYRWTGPRAPGRPGESQLHPRRVVVKPPRKPGAGS